MSAPHEDVPEEEARNAEYLTALRKKLDTRVELGLARSRTWVDPHGPSPGISVDDLHPLVGRVGLGPSVEGLEQDFYIGPRHVQLDDFCVYSWSAPVAALFYALDGGGFEGADALLCRRTLIGRREQIVDAADEVIQAFEESPFKKRVLSIPAPPTTGSGRRRRPDPSVGAPPTESPENQAEQSPSDADVHDDSRVARATQPKDASSSSLPMRAADAVRRKLLSPRTHELTSVLATLQPDQHQIATWTPDESIAIQGHPGTGKTIIAAYRAAYLADPESGGRHQRILLLGPTSGYVEHVRGLVQQLDPERRIQVDHLESRLDRVAGGLRTTWQGGGDGYFDPDDAAARHLARGALAQLKARQKARRSPPSDREQLRRVWDFLRTNGKQFGCVLSERERERAWMAKLPLFSQAERDRRYLPLIALIASVVRPRSELDQFDHIVVDEAQDLSPIEWMVLDQIHRSNGHWTLVGDMNQRRTTDSFSTWQEIDDQLALTDGTVPFAPLRLQRGYRSTRPILEFADSLLPKSERGVDAVQTDGPIPTTTHVRRADALIPTACDEALRLASRYSAGLTCVIATEPDNVANHLASNGWRRRPDSHDWSLDDVTITVLGPAAARGLEFDAVVVVEPSLFKQDVGKFGQLYTSLTRANRELAVVWHRNLQEPLRQVAARQRT